MVKSRDYWAKRQTQLMAGLDKKDDKFSMKLAKEYDKILDDMQKKVAYYYQNYGVDNVLEYRNMMKNLSDNEREKAFRDFDTFVVNNPQYVHLVGTRNGIYNLNRMEALEMSTRMKMAELGIIEQDEMKEYLKKSYEYGYMSTAKSLDNYSSFFNLDNQILEATLNQKWFDNKNYSDRIWGNKDILRNYLTSDLRNGIISGSSYDKMIKQLQQRIDVGKSNARRLVWTESAFMLNQANARAFIDDGIERYDYVAIIDSRTSEVCKALNEQSFEFSKYQPGLNAPPMHGYCRSTIIPIENEKADIKDLIDSIDMEMATSKDLINLGQAIEDKHKVSELLGDKEKLKEIFSNYRPMGGVVPKEMWYTRSNKIVREQLDNAFSFYPQDWANYLTDNNKKIFAGKTRRGFFSQQLVNAQGNRYLPKAMPGEGVSIYSSGERPTTPFHEIGHMIEHFNPNVVRIEKEFVKSRTVGEEETRLRDIFPGSGYSYLETTKKDNFISPYIGKDYNNATEVLSMGLESIFVPGRGHIQSVVNDRPIFKKITDDPEYLKLIIGLILKG